MDFRPQQDGYYHILTEETMMKLTLAGLALALALFTVTPAHAQQPDETPGQQVQISGANLPIGGYSCGRATYPTYCYGIPADVGGTFWLDVYTNAYPSPTGFIAFNNVLDLGQASITTAKTAKNTLGQITQLDVSFTGLTNDGDSGTYVGTATFHFTYTKMVGGSGRGGGYPGYLMYLAGYTMKITYS
jgi:hypothetical protein